MDAVLMRLSSSFKNWSLGKVSKYPATSVVSMLELRFRISMSMKDSSAADDVVVNGNGISDSIMFLLRSRVLKPRGNKDGSN